MWVCLSDAFLSIVIDQQQPGNLLVRARLPGDIEAFLPVGVKVTESPDRDYRYRASVPRHHVATALIERVNTITYGNFKNSIPTNEKGNFRHDFYEKIWGVMMQAQRMWLTYSPKPAPKRRAKKVAA